MGFRAALRPALELAWPCERCSPADDNAACGVPRLVGCHLAKSATLAAAHTEFGEREEKVARTPGSRGAWALEGTE